MSFQGLQERLAQLQETTSQLKTLINRLANLKLQPGSVPLDASADSSGGNGEGGYDDGNIVSELGADITQGLRETDEELELLREEIVDLRSARPGSEAEKTKARLKDAADRLGQELKDYRIAFRKAQLSARQRMAAAQRAERAALLASYARAPISSVTTARSNASSPVPPQQQQQQPARRRQTLKNDRGGSSKDDTVVGAAHDVTASLQRTHDLMAAELARSSYAAQALAESTAALRELDDRYAGLDGMLAASRSLLGTLMRSQKSDTWYLQTTLYLLLATAAWLVFRRLLYGPLWWLVWLPLRMTWWSASKGVSGGRSLVGGKPGGARMEVVSTSGSTSVVGMAGDDGSAVPTVRVPHGGGGDSSGDDKGKRLDDSDSMVDKVGRMIDSDGDDEIPASSETQLSEAPNPKKRMWEEPVEPAQDASAAGEVDNSERTRVKDEL